MGAGVLALAQAACSFIGPHRGPDGRTYLIDCASNESPCHDWFIKAPTEKDWTKALASKSQAQPNAELKAPVNRS